MISPLRSTRGLDRLAVDRDQGVRRGGERETFPPLKFQRQVLIPNAVVVELQVVSRGASDAERKTADNRLAARLFSGKNVEVESSENPARHLDLVAGINRRVQGRVLQGFDRN